MNRRQFVKTSIAGGVGLLAGGSRLLNAQSLPMLAKFVDPLPVPSHLPHSDFYHITMNQTTAKLHRDLPPTPVWAYNGNFLGVLIESFRGNPITVRWENQLPDTHLFPDAIDITIHGSTPDIPQVKTVVHLHGAKVLPQFDGFPESWFTNSHLNVNPPNFRDYHYPNDQPATNLWFHDHAIGTTRLNFYAALIGNYLLRDNLELALGFAGLPIKLPPGYSIAWSGQFEAMQRVRERLMAVVPVTLVLIFALLYMNTKSAARSLLVMLAVPFSSVGAFWFLWALGYNMSVGVWVGLIALMGVDAETGMFMLLYIDLAVRECERQGRMGGKAGLRQAIVQGAVKRIRPKFMTVATMFLGLTPLLLSTGAGSDVMKRIAAPMIGGIFTSFLLELIVYPPLYEIWLGRRGSGRELELVKLEAAATCADSAITAQLVPSADIH